MIILAENSIVANALIQLWKMACIENGPFNSSPDNPLIIIPKAHVDVEILFEHVTGRIDQAYPCLNGSLPVGKTVLLTDRIDLDNANPIIADGWNALLGMLVLAYPEVHWIFGSIRAENIPDSVERFHSIRAIFYHDYDPLLDGAGLRNRIRLNVREYKWDGKRIAAYVPLRKQICAALDDEESFAYVNAYAGYRFGFRSFPVTRNSLVNRLFGKNQFSTDDSSRISVIFEDIFLNFPDNTSHQHYSDLSGNRKELLPGLEAADHRIFVTTEHRHQGDSEKNKKNHKYINSGACTKNGKMSHRYGRIVSKPFSGLFSLWSQSCLRKRLIWSDQESGKKHSGIGEGYVWPPAQNIALQGDTGHSAPGRLLQVALHMLRRCELLLKTSSHNPPETVRCAVLATDALELIGDRTPTTAMDAIRFKHTAEVLCECQFSGVEYHIELHSRLKEIRKETIALSQWFNSRRKNSAALNSEMETLMAVQRILRDHSQFDEVLKTQNRVRKLHNRLWIHQKKWRFVFLPFLAYSEFVLSSFIRFIFAISLWMAFFVWGFLHLWPVSSATKSVLSSGPLEQAFTSFTGANAFTSEYLPWNILTVLAALVGIVHIGIFIAHLYMLVSRKD